MELISLNLDVINYICEKLNIYDLARLSCSCSSLRMLYPDVEIKQVGQMRKVLADINSIIYTVNNRNNPSSSRTFGDVITKYHYSISNSRHHRQNDDEESRLVIEYDFASDKNQVIDGSNYDGGYPDVNKYRRFRTRNDKDMWHVLVEDSGITMNRKRIQGGITVNIYVEIHGKQSLCITDGIVGEEFYSESNIPPWAGISTILSD